MSAEVINFPTTLKADIEATDRMHAVLRIAAEETAEHALCLEGRMQLATAVATAAGPGWGLARLPESALAGAANSSVRVTLCGDSLDDIARQADAFLSAIRVATK